MTLSVWVLFDGGEIVAVADTQDGLIGLQRAWARKYPERRHTFRHEHRTRIHPGWRVAAW